MADLDRLQAAVETGDRNAAVETTQGAIDDGVAPLDILEAARAAGDMPHLRDIIGGAPVTLEFATHIGADGWAPDAASAVDVATAVVGSARGNGTIDGPIHPSARSAAV